MGWTTFRDPRIPKWYNSKLLKKLGFKADGIIDDSDKPPLISIKSIRQKIRTKKLYCFSCFKYTIHLIDYKKIQCTECEKIAKVRNLRI